MRLLDLDISNFMRFRHARLKLANAGMTLIEGVNYDDESATSNGAGKSTLVDALVWCLYGATTHEQTAQGDDVVNEKRRRNCEVSVRFDVTENDELMQFEVTRRRAWKKGGKRVQLLFEQIEPQRFGLTKGTIRDTQTAIDKLIGMSLATFRHACVFGQGRTYRFSRLTDTEKKAVLDEMLGSELYARAGEKAGDQLAEGERLLERSQDSLKTALESLQDARTRLRKLRTRLATEKRQARAECERLKGNVKRLQAQYVKLGGFETGSEAKAKRAVMKLQAREKVAREHFHKAQRVADATDERLRELEERRTAIAELRDTTCVTCKQEIGAKHVERQLEVIDEKIETQNGRDHEAREKLQRCKRKLTKARARTERKQSRYELTRKQSVEAQRVSDKLAMAEEALRCARERGTSAAFVKDERKRVSKARRKVRKLRAFVKAQKPIVGQLRFWQQGFGAKGLRSLMLDSTLPFLNAKLEQYTNALTAGNIAIEFKTQRKLKGGGVREDFHIDVKNKHGSSKYNMNSIGERAKIDIIVGLALQDMAASRSKVPVNVAFFDEVFDGLDSRGIDRAVQMLSQLKRESAFIISHNSDLKSFFSRAVRVVKRHGESRLEAG
jgi:DNA repair exonuclease SbcCD ATPase subunit